MSAYAIVLQQGSGAMTVVLCIHAWGTHLPGFCGFTTRGFGDSQQECISAACSSNSTMAIASCDLQVDLKQFEGMAVQHARKNKEQEEDDLDLKNRRGPKTLKDKPLKEVHRCIIVVVDVEVCMSHVVLSGTFAGLHCHEYAYVHMVVCLLSTVISYWLGVNA